MNKEEFYSNAIDLGNENQVNDLIIQIQKKNYEHLKQKYEDLQQRIDKAIEYIESKTYNPSGTINDDRLEVKPNDLLSILRGKDNE